MRWIIPVLLTACLGAQDRVYWFPKPVRPASFDPPMKPLTRLADLKAKHWGHSNWSEEVIADRNSRASVISAAPGSKVAPHLHPDAPKWWVVQEGSIRFTIGGEVVDARKGSYVFAPERTLHSLEVTGDAPAIRFEVTLRDATSVFAAKPEGVGSGEIEYIPVRLQGPPNPTDVPSAKPDRIHVNIEDLEGAHKGQSSWTEPAQRKNRVRGNFIYGHAKDNPPRKAGDRGHFHADFAEFWIVLRGRLQWTLDGLPPFVAIEGDIVYAPPKTFHIPEFWGEGPSCRLTSSTYPSANHIYDAR